MSRILIVFLDKSIINKMRSVTGLAQVNLRRCSNIVINQTSRETPAFASRHVKRRQILVIFISVFAQTYALFQHRILQLHSDRASLSPTSLPLYRSILSDLPYALYLYRFENSQSEPAAKILKFVVWKFLSTIRRPL